MECNHRPSAADRRRMVRLGAIGAIAVAVHAPATAQLVSIDAVVRDLIALDARVTVATGDIVALNTRVDAGFQTLDGVTVNVARLFDRVEAQGQALAAVQGLATATAAQALDIAGRVDAQATLIGGIDARVTAAADAHSAAVVRIDARANAQAAALVELDNRSLTNSVRIGDIGTALAAVDARVTLGSNRTDALEGRVTVNEQRIETVDARVTAVDQRVTNVNVRVDGVVGDLVALDQRVTAHDGAIAAVGATAVAARDDAADLRRQVSAGTIGLVRQAAVDAPVTIAAATGGTVVSVAGTGGDRRVSGVAAGTAANDAATVGQMQAGDRAVLVAATGYTDERLAAMGTAMSAQFGAALADTSRALRRDLNASAAGGAALAGLPQSIIPGKGMMGAAIGGRGEEVAFALGLSKAFDSESAPVLKAGAAIDARRGTVSYNAAVGIHF